MTRHCLMLAALAALMIPTLRADAAPPVVRGIDLPTVLTLADRARAIDYALDDKAEPREFETLQTIVIDPGHGGENEGALGVAGILEKYLTLELAFGLREAIQARYPNVRVVLTRYWDHAVGLSQRIHFANLMDADLFISLHYNAAVHKRAIGYETYWLSDAAATPGKKQVEGKPIATASMEVTGIDKKAKKGPAQGTFNDTMTVIQRDLQRQTQHRDSGLLARTVQNQLTRQLTDSINRGVKQANFAVLRGALMPAVVVEAGFLTHPGEGAAVTHGEHRKRVVSALVRAIENFDRTVSRR